MLYRVSVVNLRGTEGVGPAIIEAETEETAKTSFAEAEGTTVEGLEAGGLKVWDVQEVTVEEPTEGE